MELGPHAAVFLLLVLLVHVLLQDQAEQDPPNRTAKGAIAMSWYCRSGRASSHSSSSSRAARIAFCSPSAVVPVNRMRESRYRPAASNRCSTAHQRFRDGQSSPLQPSGKAA
ncbi:hypothetical protein ABT247_12175 [Kitasatospora sp. NPDC001539]|uniref:hypothetical protein n=1 Tax=Kitasatospora sp. NPDC001539 TaxID=3154384 RepID=UPI003316DDEB